MVLPGSRGPVAHLLWDGRVGRLVLLGANRPDEQPEEISLEPGREVRLGEARVRIVSTPQEALDGEVLEARVPEAGEIALAAIWVHARRADPRAVRKWAEICRKDPGSFDSRAAASEVLGPALGEGGDADAGELADRTLRGALLSSLKRRGRASLATKRAGAFLVSRLVVFILYTAAAAVFLLLLRRWARFDLYETLGPYLPG